MPICACGPVSGDAAADTHGLNFSRLLRRFGFRGGLFFLAACTDNGSERHGYGDGQALSAIHARPLIFTQFIFA